MTLTFGAAPFGQQRGAFSIEMPQTVSYVEAWPRRMRAVLAGATVLDSRGGMMLHTSGAMATMLFPREHLDADLLAQGSRPGRWNVVVGDRLARDAVAAAPQLPGAAGAVVSGMVALHHGSMDRWFEEDDPVYSHVRDPYHRVDVRSSHRHVVVRHEGVVVADSRRPKLLFETGLPVRYYLPFADVRLERLQLSATISECPYKGDGQHWDLATSAGAVPDAAWSLPHPLPEAILAIEHVCFYTDKVEVSVDGEPVAD